MAALPIDDDTKFVINALASQGLFTEIGNFLKTKYPYVKPSSTPTPPTTP